MCTTTIPSILLAAFIALVVIASYRVLREAYYEMQIPEPKNEEQSER